MFGMKPRNENPVVSPKQTGGMTATEANAVLDILINHGLANEYDRNLFVNLQTNDILDECGLMGTKFQGTKFHVSKSPGRQWMVSTYNDYLRDNEQKVVNEVNAELAALYIELRG